MNEETKLIYAQETGTRSRYTWVAYCLMAVAIIVGIIVRFKGIGRWAFTDDEFYIAQSIRFILDSGLPGFESGGYYTRGLLYQYLAAGFLTFFSNAEFWLRAIPAAFSLFSVPALFWIGRRIGGKTVAIAVVILFMLSVWQIEFARFARMYTMFQAVFLWYLVALYKVLIDEDRSSEKWLWLLSGVAPLIYEGAILLSVLNFLPIVYFRKLKLGSTRLWAPLLILVGTYLFLSYDFRRMGLYAYLPEDIANSMLSENGQVLFPVIMLQLIFKSPVWTAFFMLAASINAWLGYRILSADISSFSKAASLLLIISALLHLFGWMLGTGIVLAALFSARLGFDWQKVKSYICISVAVSFGFWVLFGLTTTHWHQVLPHLNNPGFSKYVLLIFNYPNVYAQVVYQWLLVMPVLSIFIGVVTVAWFLRTIYEGDEKNEGYLLLVAVLVMMVLIVGLLRTPMASTRYTFFLYPVIILLGAASISKLTRFFVKSQTPQITVFAIVIAAYMGIAEDYQFKHLYKIDSAETNFRMGIDRSLAVHYYHRLDYRTPADIINSAVNSEDIIVTIFTPTAYYLNRTDYIYMDDLFHLSIESARNGKNELWTNAKLLYKKEHLWNLIQKSSTPVWLIAGSRKNDRNDSVKAISLEIESRYDRFLVGSSIDQKIVVYRVTPET